MTDTPAAIALMVCIVGVIATLSVVVLEHLPLPASDGLIGTALHWTLTVFAVGGAALVFLGLTLIAISLLREVLS